MPDQERQDRQQDVERQQQAKQPAVGQAPPVKAPGPGVAAAQGLLQQGVADPKKYARVVREFPADKAGVLQAVGASPLGAGFAQQVVKEVEGFDASIKDKRVAYIGDENYFVADDKRKGAEFKVGATTGTINQDGLNTQTDLGGDKKLVGTLGQDKATKNITGTLDHVAGDTTVGGTIYAGPKDPADNHGADVHGKTKVGKGTGDAKLGYSREDGRSFGVGEVGYKDDTQDARLKAKIGGGGNYDVGATGSKKSGDTKYSGELGYGAKDGVGTLRLGAGFARDDGTSGSLAGRYTDDDNYQLDLSGTRQTGKGRTLYGGLGYGEKTGNDTVSGNIGVRDGRSDTNLSGSYTDRDNFGLNLRDDRKIGDHASLKSNLGYNVAGGAGALTGTMRGQYDPKDFVAGGGLGARYDDKGLSYNADLDATATLKPGLLYAEGFGGVKGGAGMNEPQYHMGGGLVLTPNEKLALTVSGAVDQNGGFDTRLQFDVFKKKVDSAKGLAEQKKKAAVSVFMGYRQGMDGALMNDRYGGGRFQHDEGQAYVGVGFRF